VLDVLGEENKLIPFLTLSASEFEIIVMDITIPQIF
jgi:hypothetical protein